MDITHSVNKIFQNCNVAKCFQIVNRVFIDGLTANGITWNLAGSRSGFIRIASLGNTNIPIHLFSFPSWKTLNAAITAQVYTGGR